MKAGSDDDGRRLDRILRKALQDLPLSAIHRLLRQGEVIVDGEKAGADYRVKAGQTISITGAADINLLKKSSRPGNEVKGSCKREAAGKDENLSILFEGAGLLILNKPAGIPVHGKNSLEDLVLKYLLPRLPPSLSFRPGPLHRLDLPSSGVIAFSSSIEGARFFSASLRERKIKKLYLAIVEGEIAEAEEWQDELSRDTSLKKSFAGNKEASGKSPPLAAKTAITRVRPLAKSRSYTLITADIETGRTHQIRSQAALHGHPLLGDKKYGSKTPNRGRFYLHAWRMELPYAPELPSRIEAPLPDDFIKTIEELFGEDLEDT